jgi:DNA-binding transcriptional LysR family regulator
VSNALSQLRGALGDPLFVRARRGVVPTARALALAGPVRQALSTVEAALASGGTFEPRTAERSFVIAASDYCEYVVLPALLRRLEREAPGVRLEIRPWGLHEVTSDLESGEVDLMIGYYARVPPAHLEESLFGEEYVCVLRSRHPIGKSKLTLRRYVELEHVLVSQRSNSKGSVDVALARRGLSRRVGARVSHFLMVPQLVAQTDMVAALSRRIAEPARASLGLTLHAPPLPLPRSTVGQVWHQRVDADAGHAWLRGVVRAVCEHV